jgi:hypothetical protein
LGVWAWLGASKNLLLLLSLWLLLVVVVVRIKRVFWSLIAGDHEILNSHEISAMRCLGGFKGTPDRAFNTEGSDGLVPSVLGAQKLQVFPNRNWKISPTKMVPQ